MATTSIRNLCWTSRNLAAVFLICALPWPAGAGQGDKLPTTGQTTGSEAGIPPTREAPGEEIFQERLLLVDINQQQLDQTVLVLEDQAGMLYLWREDLLRWRFRLPGDERATLHQGEKYFALATLSDIAHVYDRQQLTLVMTVGADAFTETTRLSGSEEIPQPTKSRPGAFLNYDLSASQAPGANQRAGQFELGYFNRLGVGTSNLLATDLEGHVRATRLDSTWTMDFPEKRQTLRLGDAVNVTGSWGRAVLFGGIQFGSNFGTQPGFLSFPPQSLAGQAVLPSTVDVFIGNALVSSQSVPPGPFAIRNLPVITGAGEVQLVVRDLLGREQVIVQPFYGSQALLKKGLASFSAELGFVRKNFGIASNDYGSWLGTGTYRRGLSDRFTGEIHAESMRQQATAGIGGDYLLPRFGTFKAYIAGSQNSLGRGHLASFGLERQTQTWSFGTQLQWASRGFSQVGLPTSQMAPARVSSLNLSHAAPSAGAISVAYIWQHNRDRPDSRIATLSYNRSLGKKLSLGISAIRNLVGDTSTMAFVMLNIAFDNATSLSFNSQLSHGGNGDNRQEFSTTLQRNLPGGEGYGYRVQARSDSSAEVAYALQTNAGTYSLDLAHGRDSSATRLGATGGVVMLGGEVFLSRRIDQSFAVVRIPDYPNVGILADNQAAGRTNAKGSALIPRLRAYDRNLISVDQQDLPLDAEIKALRLIAVPYFRSGVELTFPINHARGATFSVRLEDGQWLPAGAAIQEVGKEASYSVGYAGEVYMPGLGPLTRLRATWGKYHCEFQLTFTPSADPLPDLGSFICKGIEP